MKRMDITKELKAGYDNGTLTRNTSGLAMLKMAVEKERPPAVIAYWLGVYTREEEERRAS